MTLNEYIVHLKTVAKEGHGNKEVIYAADDEGNNFQKIFFTPSVGVFKDRGGYGDFDSEAKGKPNAVCIN